MEYLSSLVQYLESISDEEFFEFLNTSHTRIFEVDLKLELDKNFDANDLIKRFPSREELINHLYETDSHNFISAVIQLNSILGHSEAFGHHRTYNLDKEQFGEDPTVYGLPPYEEWDYLYMSDVHVYHIETKNLIYIYEHGENIIVIGLKGK